MLEYYKGILILTTNRPVNFDDAFYSRIHLTLRFPQLNLDSRKEVWSNFLLPTGVALEDHELAKLAEEDLNGRQIKNVVKMSRLLAKNTGESLTASHIGNVLRVMKEDADLVQIAKLAEETPGEVFEVVHR